MDLASSNANTGVGAGVLNVALALNDVRPSGWTKVVPEFLKLPKVLS